MDFETLDAEQAINKISNIVDQSHDPAHKFKMLEALRDKALRTAQNSEGEVSQEAQRAIVILERMMQEAQEEQAERTLLSSLFQWSCSQLEKSVIYIL